MGASPQPQPYVGPGALRFLPFAALLLLVPIFIVCNTEISPLIRRPLWICLGVSFFAFLVTVACIPLAAPFFVKRGMFGFDVNKRGSPGGQVKIPESQGVVVASIFAASVLLLQGSLSPFLVEASGKYSTALVCAIVAAGVGFLDDMFDLPKRVRLVLPALAVHPLLRSRFVQTTRFFIPCIFARGGLIVFDSPTWLFILCVFLFVIFCPHGINIHAGINGLEAGQTAIAAASILTLNLWQLGGSASLTIPYPSLEVQQQAHLFSLSLALPLLACSLGLLFHNWYPSAVFVGDSFTMFVGMVIAAIAIQCCISDMVALMLLPQMINCNYSIPQYLQRTGCPRFRMPKHFDPTTGLLTGSEDRNLVNLFLRVFGKCTEEALCIRLLLFQVLCSAVFLLQFFFANRGTAT